MTVRCFKSVSLSVKQKDIPEADIFHEMKFRISISFHVPTSLVVGGSLFWVALSLFPFRPQSSCRKMGTVRIPTISCASVPNT